MFVFLNGVIMYVLFVMCYFHLIFCVHFPKSIFILTQHYVKDILYILKLVIIGIGILKCFQLCYLCGMCIWAQNFLGEGMEEIRRVKGRLSYVPHSKAPPNALHLPVQNPPLYGSCSPFSPSHLVFANAQCLHLLTIGPLPHCSFPLPLNSSPFSYFEKCFQ